MCGIVGYTGRRSAPNFLYGGLKRLEYRGYDSAGMCTIYNGQFYLDKKAGRVSNLQSALSLPGMVGIGHTRWATHGAPSRENAHPHVCGKFAVVHNGIIENYQQIKANLLQKRANFLSQTDSEVIAQALNAEYDGNLLQTVFRVLPQLKGSYALAILCLDQPNCIVAARSGSPLLLSVGKEESFLASDYHAIAREDGVAYSLQDGEVAYLSEKSVSFYHTDGKLIIKKPLAYGSAISECDAEGFSHFMLKEMHEIPSAIRKTLSECVNVFRRKELRNLLRNTTHIDVVACGTAYHSALAAKYTIEKRARIPVEVCIASEYRYKAPLRYQGGIAIAVSQSGETADTLAAAKRAKEMSIPVIAITNVPYSSLTTIADVTLLTRAGQEIGVAATKSYNAQLTALYALCTLLERLKRVSGGVCRLRTFANYCEQALPSFDKIKKWANDFSSARSVYFIGRGVDYAVALEGSLKLKELTYLPSEGYAAGELKHGTLALIDKSTPVVALITEKPVADKVLNAIYEVQARGASVYVITVFKEYACQFGENAILLPQCEADFSPLLTVLPLQMLAYETALVMEKDPDKPRNLAKSVTVE